MDVWFCEGRSHSREATCELRILWQVRCARSHERASGDLCFPLTKTYMDVGNSEVMWLVGVECNIAHGWAHSIAKR